MHCKKRGDFPSLLLCIGQNMLFFVKNFCSKIVQKPSVYNALSHFCVITTRASTLLTMPVAFIFLSPFPVGTPPLRCPRTPEDGCPYNNFTNYDAIICKARRFILKKRNSQVISFSILQRRTVFLLFEDARKVGNTAKTVFLADLGNR